MKHDELVFDALCYRRNLGAELREIRKYVAFRERNKGGAKKDLAALGRLDKAGDVRPVGTRWFLTAQGLKRARGNARRPAWLVGDAMILLAVEMSCGERGGPLAEIVGAADYIDHGVPGLEQLHGALNRLAAGRLITRRRGRFAITKRGSELVDRVKGCSRRGIGSRRRALQGALQCPCCGIELKAVRWRIELDQVTVNEAYAQYRGSRD